MKIYQSSIRAYHDFDGEESPIVHEFGCDLLKLQERQDAAMLTIAAPLREWSRHLDGNGFSVRIGLVQYEARIEPVDLVC